MNTISIVVVLLGCIALSCQDAAADHKEFIDKIRASKEECIKESGANQDLVVKAFQDGNFADDKNLKCYFKCIFQKMGRMDDAGNVDLSAVVGHIPPNVDQAKAKAALDKCKDLKSPDACDTAFQVAKCMREAYGPIQHN